MTASDASLISEQRDYRNTAFYFGRGDFVKILLTVPKVLTIPLVRAKIALF